MNEKPSWLTSLDGGEGSADATGETRQAVITKNIRDLLSERNAELQKAPAVTNYNLANSTGAALVQNTANSYVISALVRIAFPWYTVMPLRKVEKIAVLIPVQLVLSICHLILRTWY